MNTLEQWVARCLAYPIQAFPQGANDEDEDYEEAVTSPLTLFLGEAPGEAPGDGQEDVSESLLFQLHAHLRNQPFEERVWNTIIWRISHPLPDEITCDLIDRNISTSELGHRPQSEAVLLRLAPLVSEALLTLVGNIYRDPERSTTEFVEILDQYVGETWLLNHLAHLDASSPEKMAAFLKRVEGLPEWELAQAIQAHRESVERERREHQHRLERSRITTDAEEIRSLYSKGEFDVLLALVRNPATPLDVLTSLSQSRNFQGAPQLRHEGKQSIYQRSQINPS